MNEMNGVVSLAFTDLLEPLRTKVYMRLKQELEEHASRVVLEEMAKFAIDLSKLVSFQDFREQLVITVRKEIK